MGLVVSVSLPLRLGIIGLSEGNGHPYSWSSIFNGYDPAVMENCGFPLIPRYLERQNWPDDTISHGQVTHVWTQDTSRSTHIAKACFIDHVVDKFTDMIDEVDGILLARDDAKTHYDFCAPFLSAGLPVYVDKPLSLTMSDAERMFGLVKYPGQLFSCSALGFAQELQLTDVHRARIGTIKAISCITPKYWDTYSVHLIEPLLNMLPDGDHIVDSWVSRDGSFTCLVLSWKSGIKTTIAAMGDVSVPISFRVMGDKGWCDLTFKDAFTAFRRALQKFVDGVLHRQEYTPPQFILDVVDIIERGRE